MNAREAEKLKKILSYLRNRLKVAPPNVQCLVKLGSLLYVTGYSIEEVLDPLNRALNLDPKNTDLRFWLAESLSFRSERFSEAKKHLAEALNVNPDRVDCLSLMGSAITYNLGMDFNQGLNYLEKAISLEPDWPALRLKLSLLLVELRKLERAKKEIELGLSSVKDNYFKSKDLVEDYYGRAVIGRSEMSKDHFIELLNVVQKKLSMGDRAPKYWSLTELQNIDFLKLFYEKKITEDQMLDASLQRTRFFHMGFPENNSLGLSKLERKATGIARLKEIAKWRYEGWPDRCMECSKKIDLEIKKDWGLRKNPEDPELTGLVHIECLNEFDKKDWRRVRKEHRAERSKRLKR